MQESEARRSLNDALEYVEAGSYHSAVPRLYATVSLYPDSTAALEARYYLVQAYSEIGSPRAALEVSEEYLRLAPDGPRAAEIRSWQRTVQADNETRFPSIETLDREIESLSAEVAANPDSYELRMAYADRLWQRGRYEEAGDVYYETYGRWPDIGTDTAFQRRIEVRGDNGYTVLSPAEIQRREVERNPVQIINTSSFAAGRARDTLVRNRYVVTGQALNRSEDIIYGVEILVSLEGLGGDIYDAELHRIDRLYPGESRAFAVTFRNFPSINQINDYNIQVTYQR